MILAHTLVMLLAGREWRSLATTPWVPPAPAPKPGSPRGASASARARRASAAALEGGEAIGRRVVAALGVMEGLRNGGGTCGASSSSSLSSDSEPNEGAVDASGSSAAPGSGETPINGTEEAAASPPSASVVKEGNEVNDGEGEERETAEVAGAPAMGSPSAELAEARNASALDEARLLSLFADETDAPFSIHRIASEAVLLGYPAGSWLAPTTISQVIALLVHRLLDDHRVGAGEDPPAPAPTPAPESAADSLAPVQANASAADELADGVVSESPGAADVTAGALPSRTGARAVPQPRARTIMPEMAVYVAMDGSVYCEQVIDTAERAGNGWQPVLIFVPLRLGLDSLNPQYAPALVELFSMPQSLGVIGGKPKAAHFFVGVCGGDALCEPSDEVATCGEGAADASRHRQRRGGAAGVRLLYLDPHTVQPALSSTSPDIASCHHASPSLPSMPLLALDPSMALGFLCTSRADFDDLCARWVALSARTLAPFSISRSAPWIPSELLDTFDADEEDDEGVML
jgi:hypothetical protein